ncbi:DUF5105 domain-containing protein [Metabacillus fastidiosus]|uniref:DUF5105 domain-containing protein n=1 Tax=Metabacillus fastidiosus TaxID=1458 RepID=A0ABU6P365_9BACI|nr:DUF5105 domain-containing protein [Metabacillus fastidiosus]
MVLKRFFIVALLLVLAAAVSACSNSGTVKEVVKGNEENTKNVEIKLGNIEYQLPSESADAEEGQLGLKIDFSLKNKGKESVSVSESHFELYSNDTKLESYDPEDYKEGFSGTSVAAGKKINGSLFYVVDKGSKFELIYIVHPFIEGLQEEKTVKFEIDGSDEKLLKTVEKLQYPSNSVQAYIDVFYYGKDNLNFEKWTGDNKEENLKAFDEGLMKALTGPSVLGEVDEAGLKNLIAVMRSATHEKVPTKIVTKSISKDTAIVEVTAKPLEAGVLKPVVEEKAQDFITSNPNASELDVQKLAFKTMADEFKNVQPSDEDVTIELQLKKVGDDQWKMDNDYKNEDFSKPFINFE